MDWAQHSVPRASIDHSKFDHYVSRKLLDMLLKTIKLKAKTPWLIERIEDFRKMRIDNAYATLRVKKNWKAYYRKRGDDKIRIERLNVVDGRIIIKARSGEPSGEFGTSIIDSLINLIYIRCADLKNMFERKC